MRSIDAIVRGIHRELTPTFEERLRSELAGMSREWLVDQIVRMTLDAHSLEEIDREGEREAKALARARRVERVRALTVDAATVRAFVAEHGSTTREDLLAADLLRPSAPAKGTDPVGPEHRTEAGDALLERAKDMLYALLFGDGSCGVALERGQQELLTFALPRHKASALDFMRAATELSAAGTWQDPASVSNDERADNVLLEVQFGETPDEIVGTAVVTALRLVNNLEVNEQVLYARLIDVEETTLIA